MDNHSPQQRLPPAFVGPGNSHPLRFGFVHRLRSIVTVIAVIFAAAVTFVLGGIVGQQQLYQKWTEERLAKLAMILESGTYDGVQADHSSAAQVFLTGTVRDRATRDALRDQLVHAFGAFEADEMIWRVDVAR